MSSILKTALIFVGGTGLFAGSFVGVALVTGHSLREIPLLSKLSNERVPPFVVPPHPVATTDDEPEPEEAPEKPALATIRPPATASVLGAFVLPAPFSSEELADMQARLSNRLAEVEKSTAAAHEKERSLDERERALVGRETELQKLKDDLDLRTKDLIVRELELQRDAEATVAQEQQSWVEVARFFQEGEPAELGKKLSTFEPLNAARILRQLDDERAIAIVNALPPDKYKAFLDAYRKSNR
jgi:flagellar motility protein MotE (MotC chaperone)